MDSSFLHSFAQAQRLITFCSDHGFPNKLRESLENLLQVLENSRTFMLFVREPSQFAAFDALAQSPSGRAAWLRLLNVFSDANRYLSHAQANEHCETPFILLGNVEVTRERFKHAHDIGSSEIIRGIAHQAGLVTMAYDHCRAIYTSLTVSHSQTPEDEILFTQLRDTLAIIKIAFRMSPFALSLPLIQHAATQAVLDTFRHSPSLNVSILNHPKWTMSMYAKKEVDIGFRGVKMDGEEWADRNLQQQDPWKVVQEMLGRFNPPQAWLTGMNRPVWQERRLRLDTCAHAYKTICARASSDLHKHCVRIAICGPTSCGKSSLINALAGCDIIASHERAETAWPILVRHDSSKKGRPMLSITPAQFDPYLQTLRRPLTDAFISKLEEGLEYHSKCHLHLFLDPTFSFPTEAVTGVEAIHEQLSRINSLVRLAYKSCSPADRPHQETNKWPILSINFELLSDIPHAFEFLELPGFTDATINSLDLQAQSEAAIQDCDGVLFVFRALPESADNTALLNYMTYMSRVASLTGKPILAVGTHLDQDSSWNEACLEVIMQALSVRSECIKICSPSLYRSAVAVKQRLRNTTDTPSLVDLSTGVGQQAISRLFGPYLHKYERYMRTLNKEALEIDLRGEEERSRFSAIPSCIRRKLASKAIEKQCAKATQMIYDGLENLRSEYQILLDLTCKTGVNLERTVESMLECQSLCMSICTRWEGEAVELAGELRAWGTNQMAKFRREAEDAVYAHVERIPDINLLNKAVTDTLTEYQKIIVSTIRQDAQTFWTNRFSLLLQTLAEQKPYDSVQSTILGSLEDALKTVAQEPLEKTMNKLKSAAEDGSLYLRARKIAEDIILERQVEDAGFRKAVLASVRRAVGTRLGLSHFSGISAGWTDGLDARRYDQMLVNEMGFLIRPAVLATIKCKPLDAQTIRKLNTSSGQEKQRIWLQAYINPWWNVLEKDCNKTVDAVATFSGMIGRQVVEECIHHQIQLFKAKLSTQEVPLHANIVGDLVIAQLNCVAASSAVNRVLVEFGMPN